MIKEAVGVIEIMDKIEEIVVFCRLKVGSR